MNIHFLAILVAGVFGGLLAFLTLEPNPQYVINGAIVACCVYNLWSKS